MELIEATNDTAYFFSTLYNQFTAKEPLMGHEQAFEYTQRAMLMRTGMRYPGGWSKFTEEIDFLGDQIKDLAHY